MGQTWHNHAKNQVQGPHGQREAHLRVGSPGEKTCHLGGAFVVAWIKKSIKKRKILKMSDITFGEISIAKNWCGRIWRYGLWKWFFWFMRQALIFSTCRFSEDFFYISLKYTHKQHHSAFINKYRNFLLFNTVAWVLFTKKITNHFLLKKCKVRRESKYGRPWLHMESFRKCLILVAKAFAGKILT